MVLCHGGNHLGSKHLRSGHAEEYIRTLDSISQRAGHVLAVGDLGHLLLCQIQTLIALADDAEALNHRDMLDAEEHQELGNGDSSRTAAVDNHLDLIHLAAGQAAGVSSAAPQQTAVPCWSSWNTGISQTSLSRRSISKQRGAAISSRLMPPNEPEIS